MGHSLTSTRLVLQIIRSVTTERDVKCVHQLAEVRDQISFHPDITDTMNTLYGEELSSSALFSLQATICVHERFWGTQILKGAW
jgi:hypothetical protein